MLRTLMRRPRAALQHATAWIRTSSNDRLTQSAPDAHTLQLGGLEPRLLLSATPISPEMMGADVADGLSSDPGVDAAADGVSLSTSEVLGEQGSNSETGRSWIANEDFNDGIADLFEARVGNWTVNGGRYHAVPNGDAISTVRLDGTLPADVDIRATVNADLESGNLYSDGLVIFDYQGPTDFKFAGAYARADRWVIGHRTASTWETDAYLSETVEASTDYELRVVIESDSSVTLFADEAPKLVHNFSDPLTDGEVGVGTWNAISHFDDVVVQQYVAPRMLSVESLPVRDDFSSGTESLFEPRVGAWLVSDGRYHATPASDAISTLRFDGSLPTDLDLQVTVNADLESGSLYSDALVVFDYHSPTDFKFAGAYARADRWVIGHRTDSNWVTDSYVPETIEASTDYHLRLVIEGDRGATLYVDGAPKVAYDFAESLTDGDVGVGTWNAMSAFDDFSLQAHLTPVAADPDTSVTTRLDGTDLHIAGDSRGAIEVTALGHDAYRISENGNTLAKVDGVLGSIYIDFGGTDDEVTLNLLAQDAPRNVVAALGGGNNSFTVVGGSIGGRLIVETADGDDAVVLQDGVQVGKHARINLAGGDNTLSLGGHILRGVYYESEGGSDSIDIQTSAYVAGRAKFVLGDGENSISAAGEIGRNLVVETGTGDDTVRILTGSRVAGSAKLHLGDGDDQFLMDGQVDRHLNLQGGEGDDSAQLLDNAAVGRTARMSLGDGDNAFTLAGRINRNIRVESGDGEDTVDVDRHAHVARNAVFSLGGGDDELLLAGQIKRNLVVHTGAGLDTVAFLNDAHVGKVACVKLGSGDDDFMSPPSIGRRLHVDYGEDDAAVSEFDKAEKVARCARRLRSAT